MKRLLKMPLAFFRVGEPSNGTAQLFVMESATGADYKKICSCLEWYFICIRNAGLIYQARKVTECSGEARCKSQAWVMRCLQKPLLNRVNGGNSEISEKVRGR